MLYAQFFQRAAVAPYDLIEACGDRSVIILDDRFSLSKNIALAHAECIKRGYLAFQLHRGETFTRSHPATARYSVAEQEVSNAEAEFNVACQ